MSSAQKRLISNSSGWRFDPHNNLILPNSIHYRRLLYYFKATLKENFVTEFFTNVKALLQEKEIFNTHIKRYRENQEEFKKQVLDELSKDDAGYIRRLSQSIYSKIVR